MSVKECSPLCFRVALKVFSELYFRARISCALGNTNKILSEDKMVIYILEITEFKEIPLVRGQAQGADPGAVRIFLCWEWAVIAALSHWLCPVCPCRPIQINPWPQQPFTIFHSKCVTSIFVFYVQDWGFSLFHCHSKDRTVGLPVPCQLIFPAHLASHKCICPWSEAQALIPAPPWPHWVTFKLCLLPVPQTLPHHRDNHFRLSISVFYLLQ